MMFPERPYGRMFLLLGMCSCLLIFLSSIVSAEGEEKYLWLEHDIGVNTLERRIKAPEGFARVAVTAGSFAEWLRGLPLKQGRPPVRLYDGRLKTNQRAHFAVVDIDVGRRNLQQCADAVIRMRAEYLYVTHQRDALSFRFTSGDEASFIRWSQGYRPKVKGGDVSWSQIREASATYDTFQEYLRTIFTYAGTHSLQRELTPVNSPEEMQIGDVFIEGGFPGHAVIVVDMAKNEGGEKKFLLAQSYMPAQDIHILRNPKAPKKGPWYDVNFKGKLETPEWTFEHNSLRTWKAP